MKNILVKSSQLVVRLLIGCAFCLLTVGAWAQAPTVVTYDPLQGATGVALDKSLVLTFNENIVFPVGVNGDIVVYDGDDVEYCRFSVLDGIPDPGISIQDNRLILEYFYMSNTGFYVVVPSGLIAAADDGSLFGGIPAYAWSFTTGPDSSPSIVNYNPSRGATGVVQNKVLELNFDQKIAFNTTTTWRNVYVYNSSAVLVLRIRVRTYNNALSFSVVTGSGSLSISGNTLYITNNNTYSQGVEYYVVMDTGVLQSLASGSAYSFAGITNVAPNDWRFTIYSPVPPVLQTLFPADEGLNIAVSANFTLTFNESVKYNSTGTSHSIKLYESGNATPIETFSFVSNICDRSTEVSGNNTTQITLNPTSNLAYGTNYYITVDAGALESVSSSTAYGGFTDATTWNFSTVARPTLSSSTPTKDATGVALNPTFSLTFNETVDMVGSKYLEIRKASDGTLFDSFEKTTISGEPNTVLTFTSSKTFEEGVLYYVVIPADMFYSTTSNAFYLGIDNSTGNNYRFTTLTNAPITTFNPVTGATGVSLYPVIEISYSKAIRFIGGLTIDNTNVESVVKSFQSTSTTHVLTAADYEAQISSDKKKITLTFRNPLLAPNDYTLVMNAVEDNVTGQDQLTDPELSFTTSVYNVWTGAVDADWTNAGNWSGTFVANQGVLLSSGKPNYPILTGYVSVNYLIMEPGSKLTVNSGVTLNVGKDFEFISSNSETGQPSFLNNGTLTFGPTGRIITRQRISSGSYAYYFSSPVASPTVNSTSRVYQRVYNPYNWSLLSTPVALNAAQGYAAYNSAGADLSLTGSAFNQTSSDYVINTAARNSTNFGWHLAGNPYPCAIEWTDLTRSDLFNHYYIRRNETTGYGVYNGALGTAVNLYAPYTEIPPMHAFYVQTTTVGLSGVLTIPASARRHNTNSYFKSAAMDQVANPVLKLVSNANGVLDECATVYTDGGALSWTDNDSEKILTTNTTTMDLFVVASGGQKCAIKALPALGTNSMVIPIGFRAPYIGSYTIGISSNNGLVDFPANYSIKLHDKINNTYTDLRAGAFSFSVASTGLNTSLLELVLEDNGLATVSNATKIMTLNVAVNDHFVVCSNMFDADDTYELVDVNGKVLLVGKATSLNQGVPIAPSGLFLLKVIKNGEFFVNKVLVKP